MLMGRHSNLRPRCSSQTWSGLKWGSRLFGEVNGAVTWPGRDEEKDHRLTQAFLHPPAELARCTKAIARSSLQPANHPKALGQDATR